MFVSHINHVIQDLVFTRSKRPQVENPKVKVVEVSVSLKQPHWLFLNVPIFGFLLWKPLEMVLLSLLLENEMDEDCSELDGQKFYSKNFKGTYQEVFTNMTIFGKKNFDFISKSGTHPGINYSIDTTVGHQNNRRYWTRNKN